MLKHHKVGFLILTLGIIACAVLLSLRILDARGSSKSQQTIIQVNNKTYAIEVLDSRVENGNFKITLKNRSNRNITSYEVSLGGGKSAQTELLYTNEVIAPGQVFSDDYPVDDTLIRDGFGIVAVIFEDGTGNGDARVIRQISDIRYGEKLQYQRSLPLLERAASVSDNSLPETLDQLPLQISSPENQDSNLSPYVKSGIQNAKNHLIQELQTVKEVARRQGNSKAKSKLLVLMRQKQTLIKNLSVYNK
jgi:hypothetical protein